MNSYYKYQFTFYDEENEMQLATVYECSLEEMPYRTLYDENGDIIQFSGSRDYLHKLSCIICRYANIHTECITEEEFDVIINA